MTEAFRVADEQLYYRVDSRELPFQSSKDVKPNLQIFGQDVAKDALVFAIECQGRGMNAYVRGLSGTGRRTLVKQVFKETRPKARRQKDYCYVHNFSHPNSPRLVVLEGGYGKLLKQMLAQFCHYISNDLPKTLNSESIRVQRKAIEDKSNQAIERLYQPFEKALAQQQLTLANIRDGENTRMVIMPLIDGQLLTPELATELSEKGQLSEADKQAFNQNISRFQQPLNDITDKASQIVEKSYLAIREIDNHFVKEQLGKHLGTISKKFSNAQLDEYLDEIIDDFIENVLYNKKTDFDPTIYYGVNILTQTYKDDYAAIVFEPTPTLSNLLGATEAEGKLPPYASITAGSLIKADGGFLVLEVDEALSEGGTWAMLMRTIRSGKLSFTFEDNFGGRPATIQPESIPLDVKFILIGSHQRFYELGFYQGDFLDSFKVLVDLDSELPHVSDAYLQYAHVLRKFIDEESLLHFDKTAIAQLIEHGIRLSGGKNKISTRFGRVMDTAREANYLAIKDKQKQVSKKHIINAIRAKKRRSYAPAKRFYELLENGTIIVDTDGKQVGQINGLAVSQAGTIRYGFPARITATLSPGKSGLINIEGQADLSGNIHTKGFQILGGLLRYLLRPAHPLSFSASIAFEQSYGGIDGDSASGAEACCLLSALTKVPIKQNLALTGAIDQFGQLQAIGGVNEKIEGFFDCCRQHGLTGEQGVIIPTANVGELMLRDDVVRACENRDFHVYAVPHVLDALAILTDTPSCKTAFLQDQPYPPQSLLAIATEQVSILYQQSQNNGTD